MSQKEKERDQNQTGGSMGLRHDYVTNLEENKRDHVTRKRAENNHSIACATALTYSTRRS